MKIDKITKLKLENFKKIRTAELNLKSVNVIVGGNNSGKSSLLQGILFSIVASIEAKRMGYTTFTTDLLLYNPINDFTQLRHAEPYQNTLRTKKDSNLKIECETDYEKQSTISFSITLSKGRNQGNIQCNSIRENTGISRDLGKIIADDEKLFCIYAPGLAGISKNEELRGLSIVKRGVAGGEANLYLRNTLYYIKQSKKLLEFNNEFKKIYNDMEVGIQYNPGKDQYINAEVINTSNRKKMPLELCGTGMLQVIQIIAYTIYFEPKLVLLDEPDSHLHPNNQRLLCNLLLEITQNKNMQVLLCTHSRHMVEFLQDPDVNFIWMKDGEIIDDGPIKKIPILMDLGALDIYDKFRAGQIKTIFLSEDTDINPLKVLLKSNGLDSEQSLILSYKTSSQLSATITAIGILKEIAPEVTIVVHRDRDFMIDEEVDCIKKKIFDAGGIPFVTEGSDIESFYIKPDHISMLIGKNVEEIQNWIEELAKTYHNEIHEEFIQKRNEINRLIYKDNQEHPKNRELIGVNNPLPIEYRKGKTMLKKIRGNMQAKFGITHNLISSTTYLQCKILKDIVQ